MKDSKLYDIYGRTSNQVELAMGVLLFSIGEKRIEERFRKDFRLECLSYTLLSKIGGSRNRCFPGWYWGGVDLVCRDYFCHT